MATLSTRGALRPTDVQFRGNPWETWRLGWLAADLWMTAADDLMSRGNWLTRIDPAQTAAQTAARRDWQRRWSREVLAGMEMAMDVQRAGYALWFDLLNPPLSRPMTDPANPRFSSRQVARFVEQRWPHPNRTDA